MLSEFWRERRSFWAPLVGAGALCIPLAFNACQPFSARNPAAAIPRGPLIVDENSHVIVMQYEAWFAPGHTLDGIAHSYTPQLTSAAQTLPSFGSVAAPAAGYYSEDPAVLQQHARWIEELGADALIAEQSNGAPCDLTFGIPAACSDFLLRVNGNTSAQNTYSTTITNINKSTLHLHAAFASLGTRLKIIPMIDGQDFEMYKDYGGANVFDRQIEQFLGEMQRYPQLSVIYKSLPLLLVYLGAGQDRADPNSILNLAKGAIAKYQGRLTIRLMAGFLESQPTLWQSSSGGISGLHPIDPTYQLWSWIDRLNVNHALLPTYTQAEARVEAFTVSTATPGTTVAGNDGGWNATDASLYADGATFAQFMTYAQSVKPIFLIVDQFNEYAAPDQGVDKEHSNDIEPTVEWGFERFNKVKQGLSNYRAIVAP